MQFEVYPNISRDQIYSLIMVTDITEILQSINISNQTKFLLIKLILFIYLFNHIYTDNNLRTITSLIIIIDCKSSIYKKLVTLNFYN